MRGVKFFLELAASNLIFALLFEGMPVGQIAFGGERQGLPHSIMVVRQILVLFVEVRTLVGQHGTSPIVKPAINAGFIFSAKLVEF